MRRILATILAIAVLFIVFRFAIMQFGPRGPALRMQDTAMSMVGRTEAEVIAALGPPRYVVKATDLKDGRTVNSPWERMNFVPIPERKVRNKVLLYYDFNLAVYVYLDERGTVEYVCRAAT